MIFTLLSNVTTKHNINLKNHFYTATVTHKMISVYTKLNYIFTLWVWTNLFLNIFTIWKWHIMFKSSFT